MSVVPYKDFHISERRRFCASWRGIFDELSYMHVLSVSCYHFLPNVDDCTSLKIRNTSLMALLPWLYMCFGSILATYEYIYSSSSRE